jgi:hypothetical protein
VVNLVAGKAEIERDTPAFRHADDVNIVGENTDTIKNHRIPIKMLVTRFVKK